MVCLVHPLFCYFRWWQIEQFYQYLITIVLGFHCTCLAYSRSVASNGEIFYVREVAKIILAALLFLVGGGPSKASCTRDQIR